MWTTIYLRSGFRFDDLTAVRVIYMLIAPVAVRKGE